ncbi:MAG: hypothetical protein ACXVYM_04105 [Gaiellaceae bacterium]
MTARKWLTTAVIAVAGGLPLAGCGTSNPVDAATSQISRADAQGAAVSLESAAATLEQSRTLSGTYAGATLADASIRVVRADAGSYCLELTSRSVTYHLAGPGGTVAPGAC